MIPALICLDTGENQIRLTNLQKLDRKAVTVVKRKKIVSFLYPDLSMMLYSFLHVYHEVIFATVVTHFSPIFSVLLI